MHNGLEGFLTPQYNTNFGWKVRKVQKIQHNKQLRKLPTKLWKKVVNVGPMWQRRIVSTISLKRKQTLNTFGLEHRCINPPTVNTKIGRPKWGVIWEELSTKLTANGCTERRNFANPPTMWQKTNCSLRGENRSVESARRFQLSPFGNTRHLIYKSAQNNAAVEIRRESQKSHGLPSFGRFKVDRLPLTPSTHKRKLPSGIAQ